MTALVLPSAGELATQVWVLLGGGANDLAKVQEPVNIYRGKVINPPAGAEDKTVDSYAVLYAGAGVPTVLRAGGGRARNLAWSFQVTCVGGDDVRALWCVDWVRGRLTGTRLQLPGGSRSGLVGEVGDPGPMRRDEDFTPNRYYLPLDFGVPA